MTVHLLAPQIAANRVGARTISRTTQSKLKSFFDDLVNITPLPPPADADGLSEGSTQSNHSPRKPRIVYVRDFNTLASSASHWYPALLQAVRQRRAGPISRTTSPVLNPTTIVFGVTPPVVPKVRLSGGSSGTGGGVQSGINVLTNQRSASSSERERVGGAGKSGSGSNVDKGEWGEDESSDRAREKRLKERLKKWEKGDWFLLVDELPTLQSSSLPSDDTSSSRSTPSSPEGGFPGLAVGGPGGLFSPFSGMIPAPLLQTFMGSADPRLGYGPSMPPSPSADGTDRFMSPQNFFRSSVIVPSQRSAQKENHSRVKRRREINQLTVRMALASVGGTLPSLDRAFLDSILKPAERSDLLRMWEAWGSIVFVWSVVKQVVDRAVASVLIAQQEHESKPRKATKPTLDPTVVPWSAVTRAFLTKASEDTMRRHWAKETARSGEKEGDGEGGANTSGREGREEELDEEIEKVKQDPDLDEHEQRLLGCIVDPRKSANPFMYPEVTDP